MRFPCGRRGLSASPTVHIEWQRFTPKVLKPGAAPLLLIHGFGCGANDWGAWPKVLGAKSKREVLFFDNRGVGSSAVPAGPYAVSDLVADAHAVVEAAGVDRVSVLGISLGGMVAQNFALTHPQRTASLVLGCTSHGGRTASPPPESFFKLCQLWAAAEAPNEADGLVDEFMRWMLPAPLLETAAGARLFEQFKQAFLRTPRSQAGLQGQLSAMARFNSTKQLGGLSCPTLVTCGAGDQVMQPANSESLARLIPGARLRTWEGAGHFFWAHRTAEVVEEIGAFLERGD